MTKLITDESPELLISAFFHNKLFHNLVIRHEIAGSSYETMLEDVVINLIKEISNINGDRLRYARKYGVLIDDT